MCGALRNRQAGRLPLLPPCVPSPQRSCVHRSGRSMRPARHRPGHPPPLRRGDRGCPPSACNQGNAYRPSDGQQHRYVESVACAVAVHGGQQDLACPHLVGHGGPSDGIETRWGPAAVDEHLKTAVGLTVASTINSDNHTLLSELGSQFTDQARPLDGCGVDRDLVGSCTQYGPGILDAADSASDREGMNTSSAVWRTMSMVVSRESEEAVMSRKTNSSAPSSS